VSSFDTIGLPDPNVDLGYGSPSTWLGSAPVNFPGIENPLAPARPSLQNPTGWATETAPDASGASSIFSDLTKLGDLTNPITAPLGIFETLPKTGDMASKVANYIFSSRAAFFLIGLILIGGGIILLKGPDILEVMGGVGSAHGIAKGIAAVAA